MISKEHKDLAHALEVARLQIDTEQQVLRNYKKAKETELIRHQIKKSEVREIVLGNHFRNLALEGYKLNILNREILTTEFDQFHMLWTNKRGQIIILQNNDFSGIKFDQLQSLSELINQTPHNLLVIVDTDNHHWYEMSIFLASLANYYIPVHPLHLEKYAHLTEHSITGVLSGSIQWKREFLMTKVDQILHEKRSKKLMGRHNYYAKFWRRAAIVESVHKSFPAVKHSEDADYQRYHFLSENERLEDWISSAAHFVSPVNNDTPYRIFDALVTGGIVFVPFHIKSCAPELRFNDFVVGYTITDVIEPDRLKQRLDLKIEQLTTDRDFYRHNVINNIKQFHGDNYLETIVNSILCDFDH